MTRVACVLLLFTWLVQPSSSFSPGVILGKHFARAGWHNQRLAPPAPSQVRCPFGNAAGGARKLSALAELDQVGGVELRHHFVPVDDGVKLHVVEAGAKDAPTVCLLHGFPDFWLSWRRQIPPLVKAGYRVICPDMRGYAKSSKPRGIERYSEVNSDFYDVIFSLSCLVVASILA